MPFNNPDRFPAGFLLFGDRMSNPLSTQGVGTVVQDPGSLYCLKVNSDGSINVSGGGGGGGTGTNGSTAPTTSVSNGYTNAAGNQTAVSPTTPLPEQMYGVYNTTPPTLTNGTIGAAQLDTQGDIKVYLASITAGEDLTNNVEGVMFKQVVNATYSRLPFDGFAVTTQNIKNTAGLLSSLNVDNLAASVVYAQVWDTTGAAGTGTRKYSKYIPANSTIILDDTFFGKNGIYCATGIAIGISSTATTYTAAGTAGNIGGTYI
jgi:hypothetical protein